jgi:hypothetical protein
MPFFKFALLTAVSSDEQARDDKASLKDQEEFARKAGKAQGGIETAGPFVLDGYSRSGYVNLSDALEDIPPLKDAIEAIDKYDVLILDNLERLGHLAPMVFTLFAQHKKQIHSARQSGRIHDPKGYDPSSDESAGVMLAVESIIQTYRLNKIRRGYLIGVPSRVDRGLHALSIPYGYKRTGSNSEPLQQVPEQVALLRLMKDWMLAAVSFGEIAKRANAILPPPRSATWSHNAVKGMLLNPFYTGVVLFGVRKNGIKVPKSEWRQGTGKHVPLWDEATYHAMVAEYRRRKEGKRNFNARFPFSGLCVCGVCGDKVGRHGIPARYYLYCNSKPSHWSMRYEKAFPYLIDALMDALKQHEANPPQPRDLGPVRAQLDTVKARRARVQDGYESGLYDALEASKRLTALEDEAERLTKIIDTEEDYTRTRIDWRASIGDINKLPDAIRNGDPMRVNQLLTALITRIVLTGDRVVIEMRE